VHAQARLLFPRLPRVSELTERLQLVRREPGLLAQFAERSDEERLARLDGARDGMPVPAALGRAVRHQELVTAPDVDQHLAPLARAHAGKITSPRAPSNAKLPLSSSATSARTIDSPVPLGAPSTP